MRTLALLLLAALVASACGGPAIAGGPPSISGIVTMVSAQGILIEEDPEADWGSDKAWVYATDDTEIIVGGRAVGLAEIKVGMRADAWFTGPVRDSYPQQADALRIEARTIP